MAEGEVRQYWVRNDRGTTWGPLTGPTIELLIDSGAIQGRIQVSNDGLQFAFPWRFPEVRDVFPRELWGDGAPASLLQSAPVAPPPPGPVSQPPVAGPVAAPMAGPGAINPPRAGPGPTAGPGAMRGPAPAVRAGVDASGRPIATAVAGPGAPPRPGAPGVAAPAARPVAPPPQQPTPPQDDGTTTVPAQGQLQQASPVQLYGRIAAGEHTGLLTLTLSDRTLWIHFRKGNPEFVDSSHAEDGLGASLLAARLLTAEQLQQAEGSKERFGGDLLGALFGLGILQPATAFTQLAQRGLGILGKALRAESGTFAFEVRDLPSAKAMPLGNRWAVLSDQVRRIPTADLKRRLTYVLPMPIMKSGGRVAASELRLTPHEVRALAFIDGVRSLGQLLQDVPQDAEHLLRIAFLLKELNGVSFASIARTAQASPPPPPAPGPTATRPSGTVPAYGAAPTATRPSGTVPAHGAAPGAPVAAAQPGAPVAPARPVPGAPVAAAQPGAPVAPARPVPGAPVAAAQPGAPVAPARPAPPVAGPGAPVAGAQPGAPARPAPPVAGPGAPVAGAQPGASVAPARPGTPGAPVAGPGAPVAGPGAAPRPPGAPAGAAGPGAAPRPPGAPASTAPTAGPGAARPPVAGPGARPGPPVVAAPAAAPAASTATPGADELPTLRTLAAALKEQNHFQRLGLTEQTDGGAVKVAYFRMAKLYHPDTLPPGAPPELEKLKAEVFAYIGDAYRTLTDDKSRAAYLEELKSGGGGDGVNIQSILQAEELFQKSCILVKARKYPEAVKMLNEAIALNAEEPEFFVWRAYARFLASPDKKAAQPEAFRDIQAAIKKNERMAPAHYFLGVIAKLSGDVAGSLKHFKRTVELQPDHIDAMREVRMAAQKK
ncbi:MAG: tetratricopeptide repeat protein [Myxococcaceae bacterium]|nr:MAG: tetratricopeptide repeat protein [Myxococcaceae bacterium]